MHWRAAAAALLAVASSLSPRTAGASGDLCSASAGTDWVCCDLSHATGVADAAACCALCNGTAACGAWKYDTGDAAKTCYLKTFERLNNPASCPNCLVGSRPPPPPPPPRPVHAVFSCGDGGGGSALTVFNDSSYEVDVSGAAPGGGAWFSRGDAIVRSAGVDYSAQAGTLAISSMGPPASGSDNLGAFTSFPVSLAAVAASPPFRIELEFVCYSASGLVAFNMSLPDGILNTAGGGPATQFPSFSSAADSDLGGRLGWLLNGGIWTVFEFAGVGTANGFQGSDGPAWIYNTSFAPSTAAPAGAPTAPATAVLCALDHFKSMAVAFVGATPTGPRTSWGLQGPVSAVPVGFRTSVGLFAGAGVAATTYAWGALMTGAYSTARLPLSRDVLNEKLSFWSDNGAVYFQSYWDGVCKRNCSAQGPGHDAETLFRALKAYHTQENLPFAIYQLDTWWFYQQADVTEGGDLDCVDWTPRADLWPNGLAPLTRDVPLLL